MNKTIVLTGGGSAGHVTVNLALIPFLLKEGWTVHYIGSAGIEKQLLSRFTQVNYHTITVGKLRRYWDWKNFKDPLLVLKGASQAYKLMRRLRPAVVFSKGGFVAVPVVVGAWLCRIPIIAHESDFTPGLANKLCLPFVRKVFTTFPETTASLSEAKAKHIGAIVRPELFTGQAKRGLHLCDFISTKPVLLVMGGSLGAKRLNEAVRQNLNTLLANYQVVHLCGKGNIDETLKRRGYAQFEFVGQELPDLLAMTNVVVSRAGSNSIFEFLALRKPMLLIPLSRKASRGDQILNAASFAKAGFAQVIEEENLTDETFLQAIDYLTLQQDAIKQNMKANEKSDALHIVLGTLASFISREGGALNEQK